MAAKSREIIESQEKVQNELLEKNLSEVTEMLRESQDRNQRMEESISQLDLYLDTRGWSPLFGGYGEEGPSLTQVQSASKQIRALRATNVHVQQGLRLRTSYVWEGGIHYDFGSQAKRSTGRGRPSAAVTAASSVQERIDNPINQEYFFGQQAREEREAGLFCDGQVFYLGDDTTFELRPIPVREITGMYVNPDNDAEVWAYRRSWVRRDGAFGLGNTRHEWYFVNLFWDKRVASISSETDGAQPVSKTKRMFTKPVNSMIGWSLGLPDALAAIAWTEQYRKAMLDGIKMNNALASIFATMKHNSQAGADNAAIKMGNAGAGAVSHMGINQELTALATAGQAYDFAKLFPILANAAAGFGVSAIELSSNPGNAGGSYGAARSLDRSTIAATVARRKYHEGLDREILVWMGADPKKLKVWFDPLLAAEEVYREIESRGILWGTGLYSPEEMKKAFNEIFGIEGDPEPVPSGVLLPNNEASIARKDIDTDGTGNPANGGSFTPTQGSGAGLGTGSGDQDFRTSRSD